ncbi:uncharacterized protein Tco025E_08955 [Trypanosoma conorhini]|uniref:Uncharacterized protein n=1 Tax=Trypanosoma conorhini TaxID=83891 RepID=A0A422N2V8_9TRYP|nr:uncharacterized protein Tco025E_08955 [Trypanosoma conorhini]RNE99816.1 hypothetical protein Tco025E_08955 [Trypanosoma conorhini]
MQGLNCTRHARFTRTSPLSSTHETRNWTTRSGSTRRSSSASSQYSGCRFRKGQSDVMTSRTACRNSGWCASRRFTLAVMKSSTEAHLSGGVLGCCCCWLCSYFRLSPIRSAGKVKANKKKKKDAQKQVELPQGGNGEPQCTLPLSMRLFSSQPRNDAAAAATRCNCQHRLRKDHPDTWREIILCRVVFCA